MALTLGPFTLQKPLGQGGMAEVWLAEDVRSGQPVALKILTAGKARDPWLIGAFRRELRAVARLDHPGIVWIHDHGLVTDAVAAESGGLLAAGSPWFAMEYASGGPLRGRRSWPWRALRQLLLALLDALAHAHARGVIHRDLKPANILRSPVGDPRPGWKLTDFGIAHAGDEPADGPHSLGTPLYMAPEQIRGDLRALGPWTDLYALGILAWELAAGRPPLGHVKGMRLLAMRLDMPPPELPEDLDVPGGFGDWVLTLLAREAGGRFRCAADAVTALRLLEPAADGEAEPVWPDDPIDSSPTLVSADGITTSFVADPSWSDPGAWVPARPVVRATVPRTWRRPLPTGTMRLQSASLGLFGLRAHPFTGHSDLLDELWDALLAVHLRGRPRAVVVEGGQGVGKTALVGAFTERALELGAAGVVRVAYGSGRPPGEALQRAVRRALRADGLEGPDLRERIGRWQAGLGAPRLREPLAAWLDGDESRRAQEMAVRHLFSALVHDRPVIAWLDDAHHSEEAARIAEGLLEDDPLPVLVVLTTDPTTREPTTRLLPRDDVQRLTLPPLSPADARALVTELLGPDPRTVAALVDRAGGNPELIVQIATDWVERGLLEPTPHGLVLRTATDAGRPTAPELWQARLERALSGLDEPAWQAAERAAVLGLRVRTTLWGSACDLDHLAGPEHRRALTDRLLQARLAYDAEDGWAFASPLLRDAVLARADTADRLTSHHLACAAVLQRHPTPADRERIGRHLLEGGQPAEALPWLLDGIERRRVLEGPASASALIQLGERAALAVPRWSEVRARYEVLRCQVLLLGGDPRGAGQAAERAWEIAHHGGWTALEVQAAGLRGNVAVDLDDLDAADFWHHRQLEAADDRFPATRGHALSRLGHVAARRGDADTARRFRQQAREVLAATGQRQALLGLAQTLAFSQEWSDALEVARQALTLAEQEGNLYAQAIAHCTIGEIAGHLGELQARRDHAARAVSLAEEGGIARQGLFLGNLAAAELALGRVAEAVELARRGVLAAERARDEDALIYVLIVAAEAETRLARWDALPHLIRRCEALVERRRHREPETAEAAERAAEAALVHRHLGIAGRLFELARTLRRQLDHPEHVQRLEARLASLVNHG